MRSTAWSIGPGCQQDIDEVLALWLAAGSLPSATDTREGLACLLAADADALLIAKADGHLIGSLIAAWDGWRASFYRLAVHPDWRRRGLATAMLREAERRLRARGATRLTAIVAHDDPVAMGFWEAVGYVRQAEQARLVRSGTATGAKSLA